jgi:hypothetical protein
MAINRIDAEETEDNKSEREERDLLEKARSDREKALEDKARADELRAAKAEAALEESRRYRVEPAPTGPTESQWQELEVQNPGKSRQEIQAEANKMAAIADARLRPLNERASAAEERAARAEERAARLEARRGLDRVEDKFYKNNTVLESHKDEVEAFLAEFPETSDPKVLEKRLGLASDYVRGKVKSLRSEPRRGEFSSRQIETGDDDRDEGREFDGRVDPKGLGGNRGAIALVEGIAESYGRDVRHKDSPSKVKEWAEEEGRGVAIDSSEDLERARNLISRGGNLGGNRGDK